MFPEDFDINFAVPSDNSLMKEAKRFRVEADKPGILHNTLDNFVEQNRGIDCKICIDGKKLAVGFGKKLGDEDMAGHEEPPTLLERQAHHKSELDILQHATDILTETEFEKTLMELGPDQKTDMKCTFLEIIKVITNRSQGIRETAVRTRNALVSILKKVEGNWMNSDFKGAISYLNTKLIKADSCTTSLMQCTDDIGFYIAVINGTADNYVRGTQTPVYLNKQGNYECLRKLDSTGLDNVDIIEHSDVIKQHTEEWHTLRNQASMTGSNIHRGLGMRTLKEQQQYYDKVFKGKEVKVTPETQSNFDYGNENEKNALATFVAKIMPVYYPDLVYREDGCEILKMTNGYVVVSGDGTAINGIGGSSQLAVEFKCPIPGKMYKTDVYYNFPNYYGAQVLSQMAAKHCETFGNLCYSPTSSTFLTGDFDDDLWNRIWSMIKTLYDNKSVRPTKKSVDSKALGESLSKFASNIATRAEFPSLQGHYCYCGISKSLDSVIGKHISDESHFGGDVTVKECASTIQRTVDAINGAYNIQRKAAKEIIVAMISDLERQSNLKDLPHAVPISYYMSGFSLKMSVMRRLLSELLQTCEDKGVNVKVVAFDGQFVELSIIDELGFPLTLSKLHKVVWQEAISVDKTKQIAYLFKTCIDQTADRIDHAPDVINVTKCENGSLCVTAKCGYPKVITPLGFGRVISNVPQRNVQQSTDTTIDGEMTIMQYLPQEVIDTLTEESVEVIRHLELTTATSTTLETQDASDSNDLNVQDTRNAHVGKYDSALAALVNGPTAPKWSSVSIECLKNKLESAVKINSSFTIPELRAILVVAKENLPSNSRKHVLVNKVSDLYGGGSVLQGITFQPKMLQAIVKATIKGWPKRATNVLYAANIFPERYEEWQRNSTFAGSWTIITEDGDRFHIPYWYAQPEVRNKKLLQLIIDPHHLFVNNRARCCSKGMPKMGIKRDAWVRVAEKENVHHTGLSLELVVELDRSTE